MIVLLLIGLSINIDLERKRRPKRKHKRIQKRKANYDHLKHHQLGHDGGVGHAKLVKYLEAAVPFGEFENNEIACSKDQTKPDGTIDNSSVNDDNCLKYKYFEYFMICSVNIIRHSNKDCESRQADLDLKDVYKKNAEQFYEEFPDFLEKHREKAENFVKEHKVGLGEQFEHLRPVVDPIHHKLHPLPASHHNVAHHSQRKLIKKQK